MVLIKISFILSMVSIYFSVNYLYLELYPCPLHFKSSGSTEAWALSQNPAPSPSYTALWMIPVLHGSIYSYNLVLLFSGTHTQKMSKL